MATLDLLPATTYQPPSPGQVPKRRRSLNTIMEDDEESMKALSPLAKPKMHNQYVRADWSSPFSDHFPTPRGNNFMSAPIVPASPSSVTESDTSATDSTPWTRNSVTTLATDFDDIYDISDEEDSRKVARARSARLSRSNSRSTTSSRMSGGSLNGRILPSLVIPASQEQPWSNTPSKAFFSPVPPTPPPKVPMSPAMFRYLSVQDALPVSATPSLDGSMSSEQMAVLSAPPTPDLGSDEREDGNGWGGIQLQPDALATLQALSGDEVFEQQTEQVIEVSQMSPTTEMQQSPPPVISAIRRHNSVVLSPEQERSMASLTRLEIPSPGGFFSALSPNSRNTWHVAPLNPLSPLPPSSTTAEHFYKTPWSSAPVERIVEISETASEGCPTARPNLNHQDSDETIKEFTSPEPLEEEIVATEIVDYDAGYVTKLNDAATETFDRTFMWLTAQTTYLEALINPTEERDDEAALKKRRDDEIAAEQALVRSQSPQKKTVRFSEFITTTTAAVALGVPLPKPGRLETAYYRSFQAYAKRSRYRDTFVHSLPRFEAIQTQRVTFPEAHRNQLLGKYQLSVVPMSEKKKRESANVARGDETIPDDAEKMKREKEQEALEQMQGATWNVMAAKMLNGGRLIAAPVAKRLARLSRMGPTADGTPRDRARILDLGGHATCDWAWHCAMEYPNTKVYTVTTKAIRQQSNSNIRGPRNHRQVAVPKLTKLPFKDNQFDLISARSLYSILKVQSEHGENEYEACLKECMRCLKPGGYLEFSIFDSDLVNAGKLGQAKSVEFGFSLKTRGYDPTPTKAWISRLENAGFTNIKRAWMFLPMGAPLPAAPTSRDSMGVEVKLELEAMVSGSTHGAAGITGLMGSWVWERWMLKLQMESGYAKENLLEGVYDIIEEGRKCGAGWRTMNGYARKPLR